jgi:hypothetical protein
MTIFMDVAECRREEHAKQRAWSKQRTVYVFLSLFGLLFASEAGAIFSFETVINFYRPSRRHIPKDSSVRSQKFCIQAYVQAV